jgi:hypothetical protein
MPNGKCRMHGGRSAGPTGSRNGAWKGGKYSIEAKEARAAVRELVKGAETLVSTTLHKAGLRVPKPYRRKRHVVKALTEVKKAAAKAKEPPK